MFTRDAAEKNFQYIYGSRRLWDGGHVRRTVATRATQIRRRSKVSRLG